MPELPEVHTTVEGIKKVATGKTIKDVWSDFYIKTSHGERKTIKNKKYFYSFKKIITGSKIIGSERRGKNILINLDNSYTIIIHMKMTGHVMYGKYKQVKNTEKDIWTADEKGPLQDPFNKFIHLVFSLSDGKHLVLSDMRKFASVTFTKTSELENHESVGILGPEPLSKSFSAEKFYNNLQKVKTWPIKSALLNQELVAGIGNIYSDEVLWETGIHPLSQTGAIPKKKFDEMFVALKIILKFSIKVGGDSKSDYRNIYGERGGFQDFHKVYGKKNKKCPKKNCRGIIERIVVKGRSAHFCPIHQKIFAPKTL